MQTVNRFPVIHEVGLRDGLQIEKKLVPFELKLDWAQRLINAGVRIIQLGSFVHPVKVPQMADTDMLFAELRKIRKHESDYIFSGLVLNEKGLERGLACGVDMFCMGVSASNTHSMNNSGMTTEQALLRILDMARMAVKEGKQVQLSVQSAFGCGYEGAVPKTVVMDMIKRFLDAGFTHISLADTAGHAFPEQVSDYFSSVFELESNVSCTCHFHNTYGAGIANCIAAWNAGVKYFETSFGGLGGCPFTRIHSGNVCTEDLITLFLRMGMKDLPDVNHYFKLTHKITDFLGRDLAGCVHHAGVPDFIAGGNV